jgi:hypothetical protein
MGKATSRSLPTTEASDKSVLSSQRGNAGVDDGLRAMAYRVIAVRIGYRNVGLEYRPLDVVTIWATSGKERASGEVSVPEA